MIETTWKTVGEAYYALLAREMDARIMAAMGLPIPETETQRIRRGLNCLHEYVAAIYDTLPESQRDDHD